MTNRIKDTDYLAISARIRAMETSLLTRERMEQLLEARSDEEAAKLLQECGYPQLDATRPEVMDAALSQAREELFSDLGDSVPDARYIDLFKLKYDYHNIKAILKAEAVGADARHMLSEMGRVSASQMQEALRHGTLEELPPLLAEAAAEAREVLETTRDPQLADIVLDRWCYREMASLAEETGSAFLQAYVQVQIDGVNLRALIRTMRMGKSGEFLRGVLLEGGEIPPESVLAAAAGGAGAVRELYEPTGFAEAAAAGAEALSGGPLTEFEKLCDDAVSAYLSQAQLVPFGEAPLVGYLAARETEFTNLRILLMGRGMGLSPDVIRSRLRAAYV